MFGRRVVAAVAAVGDDAGKAGADLRFDPGKNDAERRSGRSLRAMPARPQASCWRTRAMAGNIWWKSKVRFDQASFDGIPKSAIL